MDINDLQIKAHANSVNHGFWDATAHIRMADKKRDSWLSIKEMLIAQKLALIHSEVSEALEALRETGTSPTVETYDDSVTVMKGKPTGFGSELADIVIRVADLAEWLEFDLSQEIEMKMRYNATRSHKHGKRF